VKPVVVHAEADAEVKIAITYYEGRRKGLGREFREELERAFERIRRLPQAFAAIDAHGTRKHRLHRFPYTIYYVELDQTTWIAAVAHQKRRPGYWSGRSPDPD
jgi:plasmid stabilization system protein ParE